MVGGKLLLVLGLWAFVALAWVVERGLGLEDAVALPPAVALLIAVVPAALWLALFYLQDRHEPEPKAFVAGVFILGAAIAAPLADFLVYQVSPPMPLAAYGLSPFQTDRVVHAILVVGLAQELCKYVVVRYTIYQSAEFDEPMDGVVYMMAVGTGFAVWLNYHRLQHLGHSVFLSTAAAMTVVTTLAHASFAGALGYVMGRAKFTRRSPMVRTVLLFFGLAGAAALNGSFSVVELYVSSSGLAQQPWKGVGWAGGFAVLVFGVLMLASRRLLADSPFRPREGT